MIKNFRELDIWKKSRLLLLLVFRAVEIESEIILNDSINEMKVNSIAILHNLYKGFSTKNNDDLNKYLCQALDSISHFKMPSKSSSSGNMISGEIYNEIIQLVSEIKYGIYLLIDNTTENSRQCSKLSTNKPARQI